jgi:hypothetical protein
MSPTREVIKQLGRQNVKMSRKELERLFNRKCARRFPADDYAPWHALFRFDMAVRQCDKAGVLV